MKKIYSLLLFLSFFFTIFGQSSTHTFRCYTVGNPNGSQTQFNEIGYSIDNVAMEYNGCLSTPAMMIAVIDTNNCFPIDNCDRDFGQANVFTPTGNCGNIVVPGTGTCRNRPEKYFIFRLNNSVEVDSLISFLNNVLDGQYILAYTWYTYQYSSLVPGFRQAFQNLGGTLITSLQDTTPYIFFTLKGQPTTTVEMAGTSNSDTLVLDTTFNCNTVSGIENLYNSPFNTFPNPAHEFINVEIGREIHFNNVTWEIVNSLGSTILNGKEDQANFTIFTNSLPKGVYWLQMSFTNQINFGKSIIIE